MYMPLPCLCWNQEQNVSQCEDRISELPSNLISQILSSLPTKNAVATSVLSTRWKQFWTLVTSLDFDDMLLLQHRSSNKDALQTSFIISPIYRVLDRVSGLDKVRLKCWQKYDVSHVKAWVVAIVKYHLKELDLFIPVKCCTDYVVARDLFSCKTLVILKLGTEFMLDIPVSICLPSLKILHLDRVKFSDDDSIKRLLLGCPVLDELNMNECGGKDILRVIHISAPVLTKLRYCKEYGLETEVSECMTVIDTPALLYLELIDHAAAEGYLVKNLPHIIKADIGVQYDRTRSKSLIDLLMGISKVQSLHLYNEIPEAVPKLDSELPTFHNLTSLVLGAGYVLRKWWLRFLEKSPCLESLVFKEGDWFDESNGYGWDEDVDKDGDEDNNKDNVPSCLLLNLKEIKFVDIELNAVDLRMVEYFLNNAEVLEKLTIEISESIGDG
ncbi:hypothetical protein RHGRI_037618 [Rhododendron griersonianum]|uniref:F-box domain-containing protein n=1 Tax=Rhododendron griersonianum TaxID=479676 RepID=A0AAV6HT54_9ERIC|nr:hypothetical protein RHGRI_037618 [Rhododendron griersonianum]